MTRLEQQGLDLGGTAAAPRPPDSFEQRWAEWQARGLAQEAQTNRWARAILIGAAIVAVVSIWLALRG